MIWYNIIYNIVYSETTAISIEITNSQLTTNWISNANSILSALYSLSYTILPSGIYISIYQIYLSIYINSLQPKALFLLPHLLILLLLLHRVPTHSQDIPQPITLPIHLPVIHTVLEGDTLNPLILNLLPPILEPILRILLPPIRIQILPQQR